MRKYNKKSEPCPQKPFTDLSIFHSLDTQPSKLSHQKTVPSLEFPQSFTMPTQKKIKFKRQKKVQKGKSQIFSIQNNKYNTQFKQRKTQLTNKNKNIDWQSQINVKKNKRLNIYMKKCANTQRLEKQNIGKQMFGECKNKDKDKGEEGQEEKYNKNNMGNRNSHNSMKKQSIIVKQILDEVLVNNTVGNVTQSAKNLQKKNKKLMWVKKRLWHNIKKKDKDKSSLNQFPLSTTNKSSDQKNKSRHTCQTQLKKQPQNKISPSSRPKPQALSISPTKQPTSSSQKILKTNLNIKTDDIINMKNHTKNDENIMKQNIIKEEEKQRCNKVIKCKRNQLQKIYKLYNRYSISREQNKEKEKGSEGNGDGEGLDGNKENNNIISSQKQKNHEKQKTQKPKQKQVTYAKKNDKNIMRIDRQFSGWTKVTFSQFQSIDSTFLNYDCKK